MKVFYKKAGIVFFSLLLFFSSLMPIFPYSTASAQGVLPYFKNSNYLISPRLAEGRELLRVDDTVGITVSGPFRYPTMYNGKIGSSYYAPGLNTSFRVEHHFQNTQDPGQRKYIDKALQSQPYYHLVPTTKDTARNVIETHKVTDSIMRNAYNGNPEYMRNELQIHRIRDSKTDYYYGDFYYIREIAEAAGGYAQNTDDSSFVSVNATMLQFVRTDWPDISSFTVDKSNLIVGNPVSFAFTGYEYVAGYRNNVSIKIDIKKDGKSVSSIRKNFKSNKSHKNPSKPAQEHAGYVNQTDISGFTPAEAGSYTADLTFEDEVKRYATKSVSFTVKSANPPKSPILEVRPSFQEIEVGDTASYKAFHIDTTGKETDVTTSSTWSIVDSTIATNLTKGKYEGQKTGTTLVKATYSGLSGSAQLKVSYDPPPEPEPENEPPTVSITGPRVVMAGEEFCLTANANDSDGTIEGYSWNYSGNGLLTDRTGCNLWYNYEGEEDKLQFVEVTVVDDKGATASATHTIIVKPPKPAAAFQPGGTFKENRKMTLTPLHPYNGSLSVLARFPLIKQEWKITALDPANQAAINSIPELNNENSMNLSYPQVVELLMKKAGEYKVERYVENNVGLSDKTEIVLNVLPDKLPVADFSTVTTIYRDDVRETDDDVSIATIKVSDASYSSDDVIAKRIWTVTYDRNNNGDYSDDTPKVLSDENLEQIEFTVENVGKYKIELEVIEEFAQPTINQFVDLSFDKSKSDRRFHDTNKPNPDDDNRIKAIESKVINVENLAPVVSYDVQTKKTVEVEIHKGTIDITEQELESAVNSKLKAKLLENNIGVDIVYKDAILDRVDDPYGIEMIKTGVTVGKPINYTSTIEPSVALQLSNGNFVIGASQHISGSSLNTAPAVSVLDQNFNILEAQHIENGTINIGYTTPTIAETSDGKFMLVPNQWYGNQTVDLWDSDLSNTTHINMYNDTTTSTPRIKQIVPYGEDRFLFLSDRNISLFQYKNKTFSLLSNAEYPQIKDGYLTYDRQTHSNVIGDRLILQKYYHNPYSGDSYYKWVNYKIRIDSNNNISFELEADSPSSVESGSGQPIFSRSGKYMAVYYSYYSDYRPKRVVIYRLSDMKEIKVIPSSNIQSDNIKPIREDEFFVGTLIHDDYGHHRYRYYIYNAEKDELKDRYLNSQEYRNFFLSRNLIMLNDSDLYLTYSDLANSPIKNSNFAVMKFGFFNRINLEQNLDNHFTILMDDSTITADAGNLLKKELSDINTHLLAYSKVSNGPLLENVIMDNSGNGKYYDSSADLNSTLDEMADYIIMKVMNNKTVNLDVIIGDNSYNEEILKASLNSVLKKELFAEGLSANISYQGGVFDRIHDSNKVDVIKKDIPFVPSNTTGDIYNVLDLENGNTLVVGNQSYGVSSVQISPRFTLLNKEFNLIKEYTEPSTNSHYYHEPMQMPDGTIILPLGNIFYGGARDFQFLDKDMNVIKTQNIITEVGNGYISRNIAHIGNGKILVVLNKGTVRVYQYENGNINLESTFNIPGIVHDGYYYDVIMHMTFKDGKYISTLGNSSTTGRLLVSYDLDSSNLNSSSFRFKGKQPLNPNAGNHFFSKDNTVIWVNNGVYATVFDSETLDRIGNTPFANNVGDEWASGSASFAPTSGNSVFTHFGYNENANYRIYGVSNKSVVEMQSGSFITSPYFSSRGMYSIKNDMVLSMDKTNNKFHVLRFGYYNKFDPKSSSDYQFTIVANETLITQDATNLIKSKIEVIDTHLLGLSKATNESTIRDIISFNENKGDFFNSDNLDVASKNIADYIISQMKNNSNIDLIFGIGDTIHKDKDQLKSKVNEIILPKLNQEGIKTSSLNFDTVNFDDGKWEPVATLNNENTKYVFDNNAYLYRVKRSASGVGFRTINFSTSSDIVRVSGDVYGLVPDSVDGSTIVTDESNQTDVIIERLPRKQWETVGVNGPASIPSIVGYDLDTDKYVYRFKTNNTNISEMRIERGSKISNIMVSNNLYGLIPDEHRGINRLYGNNISYPITIERMERKSPERIKTKFVKSIGYGSSTTGYDVHGRLVFKKTNNTSFQVSMLVYMYSGSGGSAALNNWIINTDLPKNEYIFSFMDQNLYVDLSDLSIGQTKEYAANSSGGLKSTPSVIDIYDVETKKDDSINLPNEAYFVYLQDNIININNQNQLSGKLLLSNATLAGLGTHINQSQIDTVIKTNMNKGVFIDNSSLDISLNELVDYIIADVKRKNGTKEIYLTVDEEVNYFTTYSDYEKDPKLRDRWRYEQIPTVFENDLGFDSRHNQELDKPISSFDKVGRYQPYYSAKDDPLYRFPSEFINAFEPYRKWAKDADNWFIYVHRKPVPEFSFQMDKLTRNYTLTNDGYDLDKESIDIGFGPGLSNQYFQWRVEGDYGWNEGLPAAPLDMKVYEIKSTVTDFQKRTEEKVKYMNATGLNVPPIPDFEIEERVPQSNAVKPSDFSYDPNGDAIVGYQWQWKMKDEPDSAYEDIPGTSNIAEPDITFDTIGTYSLRLKVMDEFNLWSAAPKEWHYQEVEVYSPNTAPVAGFTYPDPAYVGDTIYIESTAKDPEDDPLTYTYIIEKPSEVFTIVSGDPEIDSDGNLVLIADQHPDDLGIWKITQIVSDGDKSDTATGSLTVLDQTIKGFVNHTDAWDKNRQNYNFSKTGNKDTPRGKSVFFPGEKFMLSANTTETAVNVRVYIEEYPRFETNLILEQDGNWYGSLWHRDMLELFRDEELSFRFIATYQNGWIAETVVPIQIIDDKYWREHTTY